MNIWTEIKQRFLKFEAAHGLYLVFAAVVGIYVTLYYLEYILQALGLLLFGYAFLEGLRKIFYNPIKKEALKVVAREKYIADKLTAATPESSSNAPVAP